jgi:transposase InsO family protein
VVDITYIATAKGWLYLAAILCLFSRQIVVFSMDERTVTDLVSTELVQKSVSIQVLDFNHF